MITAGLLFFLTFIIGIALGAFLMCREMSKLVDKNRILAHKNGVYFSAMIKLYERKLQGWELSCCLMEKGYTDIAIYGYGKLGKMLMQELEGAPITVKYFIDKNKNVKSDIQFFGSDDDLPPVDAILVSASYYYFEIKQTLEQKVKCPILSFEEVIDYNSHSVG